MRLLTWVTTIFLAALGITIVVTGIWFSSVLITTVGALVLWMGYFLVRCLERYNYNFKLMRSKMDLVLPKDMKEVSFLERDIYLLAIIKALIETTTFERDILDRAFHAKAKEINVAVGQFTDLIHRMAFIKSTLGISTIETLINWGREAVLIKIDKGMKFAVDNSISQKKLEQGS